MGEQQIEFDTSDLDRHVGKPVGAGQLKEPVNTTDIRRGAKISAEELRELAEARLGAARCGA
ncbi:MAG: hypothetical protein ACRDWD_09970 [Acidimicrobiia bacterium]